MARLNLKAIEERVAALGGHESYDREFLFDLLLAYGKPKSNVTRLRNGSLSVAADRETEVAQKNVVYFKETTEDPLAVIDELKKSAGVVRYNTRFTIVTDYEELAAVDIKTGENLVVPIRDIARHYTFFLPWAGMEKAQFVSEAHADVKAAERMGKLFDELLSANPGWLESTHSRHTLNVFFARLLFCFFAEDTGIFTKDQFTNAVGSLTQPDGSDVGDLLLDLFHALDTADAANKPSHLSGFPYVNGRLFTVAPEQPVPTFNRPARDLLITLGTLDWSEINPDIFGSMFQAVVNPYERSDLGQHYTSVPNILKTIEPLFLDELKQQFDAGFDSTRKLEALLERISAIRVIDPACGSGNFLVIAYKELRKLEHAILERLANINHKHQVLFAESRINIENFCGIELADFATEIAILSLWIAKHQMNTEFKEKFNLSIPLIPLKEAGRIVRGNAARIDWQAVCPNDGGEIYIIGNPPYKGSSEQTLEMKDDLAYAMGARPFSRNLDYISIWFLKGGEYIAGTQAQLAFVTTNSVAQGQHVELMFPMLFEMGLEIGYAYTSFKWQNNARRNAGVTVAVINLRNEQPGQKYIFTDDLQIAASNINAYLAEGNSIFVNARRAPITTFLPAMSYGSKPTDGGHLILDRPDLDELTKTWPEALAFTKRFLGADELIDGRERFCLWIEEGEVGRAGAIPGIKSRLAATAAMRRNSRKLATQRLAATPYRFAESRYKTTDSIIVPGHTSERRKYIPMDYLGPEAVVSNAAFAVYDAEPWLFALLNSRMHMVWVRAVGGKLEDRYRYSNTIVYNTFPARPISDAIKGQLTSAALRVLDVREYHSERTLAELYDPDLMPVDLVAAHAQVDSLVDSIYTKSGYESDEQRLTDLFVMYEAMTAEEAANAPAKKPRGRRK